MPRNFTAGQRQQITNWEFGQRWRDLTAAAIFPAGGQLLQKSAPARLSDKPRTEALSPAVRAGKQASCASATDPSAAVGARPAKGGGHAAGHLRHASDSYVVDRRPPRCSPTPTRRPARAGIARPAVTRFRRETTQTSKTTARSRARRLPLHRQAAPPVRLVPRAGPHVNVCFSPSYTVGYTDTLPNGRSRWTTTGPEMSTAVAGVSRRRPVVTRRPVPPLNSRGRPVLQTRGT